MIDRNDGGPAFPVFERVDEFNDAAGAWTHRDVPTGGMSLRDYFAAQALAHQEIRFVIELYRKGEKEPERIEYPPMEWDEDARRKIHEWAAKDAYATADAMLAARVRASR